MISLPKAMVRVDDDFAEIIRPNRPVKKYHNLGRYTVNRLRKLYRKLDRKYGDTAVLTSPVPNAFFFFWYGREEQSE